MEMIRECAGCDEIRISDKKINRKLSYLSALALLVFTTAMAPAQHNRNPACACAIPNGPPNPHPYLVVTSASIVRRTGLLLPRPSTLPG